jgi:type IV secretion system protein VirB6
VIASQAPLAQCQNALEGVGAGIGASLRAIDCAASEMTQAAFTRLFGENGALLTPLSMVLTIFVALIGYGLITGRLRIGLSSLVPQLVTLVVVVTFATSWLAFQSVFYNLVVLGPDQIASALMGTDGSATTIFADKLDVVMLSLMEASGGGAMGETTSIFSPPGLLWTGGTMLLLGTVGVLATCKIALAVLMALGPVFIVMALFKGTRGLFTGWLKAVVLVALAPLFAVLAGSLMLELAAPVLSALLATPGRIDVRPAMAFFMIGTVHLALMFMVMKVTSTMVSGWSVFGFAPSGDRNDEARGRNVSDIRAATPVFASTTARDRTAVAASTAQARDIRVAQAAPLAANDATGGHTTIRETRVTGTSAASTPSNTTSISRVRGIGSRFKSAPIRSTETKQS